jgi:hypothetical protein
MPHVENAAVHVPGAEEGTLFPVGNRMESDRIWTSSFQKLV